MAAVGPTELPEFLSDEEMAGLEATAKLDAKASMPDFISDDEMSSLEGGGWNWGDAAAQTISGAIEGIATLPATIGDLNPFDPSNISNAIERVSAVEKPSLWNYMRAAAPQFSKTRAVEEVIDPYLAERDPQYRYLRTAGSFVGPGLFGKGIQAVRQTPGVIRTIGTLFGPEASLRRQLATDTAAGAGSELAADVSGDSPVARVIGAIFGAGSTSAITDLGKATKRLFLGASPEEIKGTAAKTVQDISGMTPREMEDAIVARPQDRLGDLMTTAEVSDNAGFAQLEKTLTQKEEAALRAQTNANARADIRDEILEGMTRAPVQTKEAVGTALMAKAAETEIALNREAENLWRKVPRTKGIDVTAQQEVVANLASRRQAGLPLDRKVETLVEQFIDPEKGPTRTSGALQDIRSDSLALLRDANITPFEQQVLTELQARIDEAMTNSLSGKDKLAWDLARAKTRQAAETFKRGTAGGSLTEEMARPAEAPKNAFKGDRRSIEQLRKAVGNDPLMMESFKRFILDDIPRDAQDQLTPGAFRKYLKRNEGGITELFGEQHYRDMQRILEDLQSEAKVEKNASLASKSNSATAQKQTVSKAIDDAISRGVSGGGGFVADMVNSVREAANIRNNEEVRALLTQAIFDPQFAKMLLEAPTQVRVLRTGQRLREMLRNGTISVVRAGSLTQSEAKKSSELFASSARESGKGTKPSPQASRRNNQGAERSAAGGSSLQSAIRQYSSLIPELIPSAEAEPIRSSAIRETYPVSYTRPDPTQAAFEALARNSYGGDMAGDVDIDSLVKAVIGQESGGKADALSPKGALGLMQIMPATAREIAGELGLETYDLKDPATNKLMGTYYLRKMLDKFGDPELALAAYNAGPSRVQGWIEKYGPSWAEISRALSKIRAYEETRNYVPRVLARLAASEAIEV